MTSLSRTRLRTIVVWLVLVLLSVPLGGTLWVGFVPGEIPCVMGWAQRTSLLLIALVALFVVRYGPRPRYVGMVVLLGTAGLLMSLRHAAIHFARDVGQGFGAPAFGVHTYVWSLATHAVVLGAAGVLLLLQGEEAAEPGIRETGRAGHAVMGLFLALVGVNAAQAFASTGPPPFMGQSDPVRFSFDPRHWVWSVGRLGGRISLRGQWTIPAPDAAAVDPDPAHGPIPALPILPVLGWERIAAPLNGALADLARDARSGRFLAVTNRYGVYVLDSSLAQVVHRVVLDPHFSDELSPLAGAAFVGRDTLAVLSTSKTYVLLRPDPRADADREWRHFRETDGTITELHRARFATTRARQMHVLSLAYDVGADELITVAVPSPRHRRLVVSRFARADLLLASEFEPRLATGHVPCAPGRTLGEYVVTAAAVADGVLYAFSAAYSTLLVIDLAARTLTAAHAVPGIEDPVGLAARGAQLLVAQADGRIAVLAAPTRAVRSPGPVDAPGSIPGAVRADDAFGRCEAGSP